jgi:hypothetical protein
MTIHPITPVVPACYGIACDLHSRCVRYAQVEGKHVVEPIGTCMTHEGYPLFIEVGKSVHQGGVE